MKHTLQEHVINVLRNTVNDKHLTQNDVAAQIDLTRQMVANYLTGRTELTLTMFERFADALGLPLLQIVESYTGGGGGFRINLKGNKNKTNQAGGNINMGQAGVEMEKLKNENYYLKKITETLENQVQDKYKQIDKQDHIITRCWETIDKLENELSKLKTTL